MAQKTRITALYERLIRDDELQGPSNSILNQQAFWEDYAQRNGFTNIRHFTDDGVSGTTFDRDGFKAMIAEVEAGNVSTIIVKDMSRFGRDYLKVGSDTDVMFRDKGIRFIAVNNGIDSDKQGDSDFTPFLNIMNEFYARDSSRKIQAIFKSRMEKGLRCSGSVPYGYRRDPEDKQHLIVDEETWQLAHRLKRTIRKPSYPDRPSNPLTGLLYCADCGHKLTHHQPSPTKKKVYDADDYYICGNYRQLTHDCTSHYIKTSTVEKLILTAIREVSTYVREDEKEFIRIVRDAASAGQEQTAREQKKRLRQVEKRIGELDELIKKLYEGNATGKIPDKHFNRLLAEYDTEQSALEQEAAELKEGITAQAEDGMRAQRFVPLVRRYASFDELTAPMLNEFIEKVVVHEADKSTGDRRQKVEEVSSLTD